MHLFSPFWQGAPTPTFPPHHLPFIHLFHDMLWIELLCNCLSWDTILYGGYPFSWVAGCFFIVYDYLYISVLSLRRGDRRDRTTQWCLYDSHEFWWDNINSRDITPQTPTAMYNKLLIWYHSVCGLSHVGLRMLKIGNGKHLDRTQPSCLIFKVAAKFWGLKIKVHQRTSFPGYFSWNQEQQQLSQFCVTEVTKSFTWSCTNWFGAGQ